MKTLELRLKRIAKRANYTIGRLYLGKKYLCDTLEDTDREGGLKIPGKTAIPRGRYKIIVTFSPKFKREMPILCDVPNFSGVRIHSGNTHNDTEGCILCGRNTIVGQLTKSRIETGKVYMLIDEAIEKNKDVYITIE